MYSRSVYEQDLAPEGVGRSADLPERLSRQQLIDEAFRLGEEIAEHRIVTKNGDVTWIGPFGYGTDSIPLVIEQLGPHLYHGTGGVSVFFAALCRFGDGDRYRDLCLASLAPLRRKLKAFLAEGTERRGRVYELGGLIGFGSFLYTLLKTGQLLDEPQLIDEAHAATSLIEPEWIANDRRVRIQTGSAGALLVLLALHEVRPGANSRGKTPLRLAQDCGRHLARTRVSFEGRPPAWPLNEGKPPILGFSYGASGISYALLRLWAQMKDPELWEAAMDGLAFLRSFYDDEREAWQDSRCLFELEHEPVKGTWKDWWTYGGELRRKTDGHHSRKGMYRTLWCHGAAGIVLGKVATLRCLNNEEVRQEIAAALRLTASFAQPEIFAESAADDLCCGHMGRIEVLLQAAVRLDDERWAEAAQVLAYRVWHRARKRGRYEVSAARGRDVFAPMLFQGVAGVGYTMLRLAAPEELPCLLLLE